MKNRTLIAVLCLLALPAWGLAQSFLLQGPPPDGKGRITLRYFWPQAGLYGDRGYDLLSGLYDLSAAYRLGERLHLVAALPYLAYRDSFVNWEQEKITRRGSGLGGISVALRHLLSRGEGRNTTLTAGAYLPTFDCAKRDYWECKNLSAVGIEADFPEFPKSLDATTLFARIARYRGLNGGWRAGLEGGAFLMIPRGGGTAPLYAQAGVAVGRSAGPVDVTAEWSGTVRLAGFVDEFFIHIYHQVGLGASWGRGRLRPGVFYTMPLDRHSRENSRGAVGVRLSYEL